MIQKAIVSPNSVCPALVFHSLSLVVEIRKIMRVKRISVKILSKLSGISVYRLKRIIDLDEEPTYTEGYVLEGFIDAAFIGPNFGPLVAPRTIDRLTLKELAQAKKEALSYAIPHR